MKKNQRSHLLKFTKHSDMYIKCKNNEKEEVLYKISTMLDKLEETCI